MEYNYSDSLTPTFQEPFNNNSCEEIKIKCITSESRNIIEVHELKEKHSSMIILELPAKPDASYCENIIIDEVEGIEERSFETTHIFDDDDLKVREKISVDENMNTQYQCFHCGLKCQNLSEIEKHYNVHTLSRPFEKTEIGYECVSPSKILNPYKSSDFELFSTNPLKDSSLVCSKGYFKPKEANSIHPISQVQRTFYSCTFCTFKCLKKQYLTEHLKLIHLNSKPFVCDICNFRCKRKIELVKHSSKHSVEKPYKCNQCDFKSKSRQYLKTHMLIHKKLKPYHCAICECKFTTKLLLKDHYINYHTHEKPFECSVCLISFKRNGSLKRHMLTHTQTKPFKCSKCDYSCSRKDNLRSHINAIHSYIKPFTCESCSFSCKFRSTLRTHLEVHSLVNPCVCNECGYRFNSDAKLKRHYSSHTLKNKINCSLGSFIPKVKSDLRFHSESCSENIISCSECAFNCKRKDTLKKHFKEQHFDPTLPFCCTRCSLKFTQETYYNLHIRAHDSSDLFCCPYCTFSTKVKHISEKHISLHSLNWSKDYSKTAHLNIHIKNCDSDVVPNVEIESDDQSLHNTGNIADIKILKVCADVDLVVEEKVPPVSVLRNYFTKTEFNNVAPSTESSHTPHIELYNPVQFEIIPKKQAKHKCPACEQRFYSKLELKEHVSLKHCDFRPYQCNQCEQRFKIKANLKQHLVVHSDSKPYKCIICDYRSKLPDTLRRHYVTHSTEKPFHCSLCKYRCKLKEKLKRHMIVHSEERPFQCLQCDYACKSRDLLKKHAVVHTRERKSL